MGVVCIVLGYLLAIPVLVTVGIVLAVLGVVLIIVGATGHAIAGRRYWY